MQLKKDQKGYRCSFGDGVFVQVLADGKDFGGLGDVRLKRRTLRSAELPILPLLSTPDGYQADSRVYWNDAGFNSTDSTDLDTTGAADLEIVGE